MAPDLKTCGVCGIELIPESRDILERGQYQIANEVRPTQVALAEDIETNLRQERGTILAEGGTGIGKSFAYLLPALLSTNKRVVVSTAKKTLQDQLAEKDIPFLVEKLGLSSLKYGLYKGKSNYACWKLWREVPISEMERYEDFINAAMDAQQPADIAQWGGAVPFWWSKISIDNCVLKKTCPHFKHCHPQPQDYNLVITNHHLMAIDMKSATNFLLGPYNTLIIDEAHQAPEAFRSAYSRRMTFSGLERLQKKIKNDDYLRGAIDDSGVTTAKAIVEEVDELGTAFKSLHRKAVAAANGGQAVDVRKIQNDLKAFHVKADTYGGKIFLLCEAFKRQYASAKDGPSHIDDSDQLFVMLTRANKLFRSVTSIVDFASDLTGQANAQDSVSEYLTTWDDKGLEMRPLDIGKIIASPIARVPHKIIMSATLAMGKDFSFTKQRFGLTDELKVPADIITEKIYKSPFKMHEQAILYLPRHLPLPAHGGQPEERSKWIRAISTEIAQLLGATKGDAFVLFSAKSDMNEVIDEIGHDFWDDANLNLIQHEGEATSTLKRYMSTKNSVLFGLKSFWEGVDVVGNKLKMVIIPKLPFPNPKDPLIEELSKRAGNNSFFNVMIPHMFFDMKQGVGRLIRAQSDRGFVVILDTRIWSGTGNRVTHMARMEKIAADPAKKRMGYGKKLLDGLGFTRITDNFEDVKVWSSKFFA
jgi:ATP-dependent DNA helicase DinG